MFTFFGATLSPLDRIKLKIDGLQALINQMSAYTYKLEKIEEQLAQIKKDMLATIVTHLQTEKERFLNGEKPYNDPTHSINLFNFIYKLKIIMDCAAEYCLPTLNQDRSVNGGVAQIGTAVAVTSGVVIAGNFVVPAVGTYIATYLIQSQLAALPVASFLSETTTTAVLLKVAATLEYAERQIFFAKSIANLLIAPSCILKFITDFNFFSTKSGQLFNKLNSAIDDILKELSPIVAEELLNEAKSDYTLQLNKMHAINPPSVSRPS